MSYPNQISSAIKSKQTKTTFIPKNLGSFFASRKPLPLFGVLTLVIVATFPYFQTLTFDFLVYDDFTHIFNNSLITDFSLPKLLKIWTEPFFKMYIPLTYTFWGLVRLLTYTPNPMLYHLLNILTHATNGILLFYFLQLLLLKVETKRSFDSGRDEWKISFSAIIGSLFFLLHPTQVEAVAWISGFKDLASTFFLLVTFSYYFNNKDRVATLFYTASLLTKPSAVIAAPLVFCINRFILGKNIRKSVHGLLLWLILAAVIFIYTEYLQIEDLRFSSPFWFRPIVFLHVISFYLEKIFFLTPSYPDYGFSIQNLRETFGTNWNGVISLLFLTFTYIYHRKFPQLLIGFTLWCLALFPVSGWISFSFQNFSIVADRYLYFPMIFYSWMLSSLLFKLLSYENKVKFAVLFSSIFILFGTLSTHQVSHWRNSQTLFEYSVQKGPKSSFNLTGLALSLKSQGQTQRALDYLNQAVETDPNQFQAENNLAELYSEMGDFQKSAEHYERLLRKFPFLLSSKTIAPPILDHYGTLLLGQGKYQESEKILTLSKNLNPYEPATLNILGELYFKLSRFEESLKTMQLANQLDPEDEKIKSNLMFLKKAIQLKALKN